MTNLPVKTAIDSTPDAAIDYFNAHTEGLGYLDSLVQVQPKAGQSFAAFWTAHFCMLEGNPQNPDKLYVSLTIPGDNVLDLLMPFLSDINNKTTNVFVNLRLAKLRGEPFIYGVNSKSSGKLGVNYSARLINVKYLKVGDNVIKLESDNAHARSSSDAPAVNNNPQAPQPNPGLFTKPLMVKLSKDDANFAIEKDRLYKAGYKWHSEKTVWIIPEIIVAQDADFTAKVEYLESIGYVFSSDHAAWRMAFPQPKSNNRNAHSNAQHATNK